MFSGAMDMHVCINSHASLLGLNMSNADDITRMRKVRLDMIMHSWHKQPYNQKPRPECSPTHWQQPIQCPSSSASCYSSQVQCRTLQPKNKIPTVSCSHAPYLSHFDFFAPATNVLANACAAAALASMLTSFGAPPAAAAPGWLDIAAAAAAAAAAVGPAGGSC